MDEQQLAVRLTRVFRSVFNNATLEIHPHMVAKDVAGWDSLNHIALIAAIEAEFQTKFKLRELMNIENVGDMMALIQAKTKA